MNNETWHIYEYEQPGAYTAKLPEANQVSYWSHHQEWFNLVIAFSDEMIICIIGKGSMHFGLV
jgi:hypothetical protein